MRRQLSLDPLSARAKRCVTERGARTGLLCCLLLWNLQEDPVANVKPHFGIVKTGSLNRDLNIVFIRFISLILRDKPRTLTSHLCSFFYCSLISFISLILRDKPRTLTLHLCSFFTFSFIVAAVLFTMYFHFYLLVALSLVRGQ